MLQAQDVRVDPRHRRVWRGDAELVLSRKEFELLLALISRAGTLVTREELMRDVWKTTFWTSSKTIDVHLGWIRRKLGDDPRHPTLITTIRGKGLRFETAPPADAASTTSPAATPTTTPTTTRTTTRTTAPTTARTTGTTPRVAGGGPSLTSKPAGAPPRGVRSA